MKGVLCEQTYECVHLGRIFPVTNGEKASAQKIPSMKCCEDKDLGRLADQRPTSWAGASGIGIGLLIDELFSC